VGNRLKGNGLSLREGNGRAARMAKQTATEDRCYSQSRWDGGADFPESRQSLAQETFTCQELSL
jgi:hypothetical protein